ncbi:uncharacterized protein LOC143557184 [Bidens hawaiensis]|uniref:uncharacterized protein LOC143557184 n=1 Tax=Bidens hawaiensis TaxID=980011 RepID=UPI00404A77ED
MEEEMVKLCNIMPVELAIKRELEYRKKIEALKNEHQNDLKPLLLAQVPVSESQTALDRKRKLQPFNAQCSRSSRSSTRFVCVVCQVAFATAYHLKMHGETFAHKAKINNSRRGGKSLSNPFLCEACDIMCSSGRVMELHVAGLRHAASLQEFEDAKRVRNYGSLPSN